MERDISVPTKGLDQFLCALLFYTYSPWHEPIIRPLFSFVYPWQLLLEEEVLKIGEEWGRENW